MRSRTIFIKASVVAAVAAIATSLVPPGLGAAPTADAEVLAERMLSALGGRERWARVRNTVNDSQQNRVTEPTVVRSVITMDFDRPRFRIETTAPGLHLVRVVDGERSWRLTRDGRVEPLPAERLEEELRWYSSHLYRTIHRIAASDPDLSLRVGVGGRLEAVSSSSGDRIAWFLLDAKGEPYAFGGADEGPGTICGPWEFERDGIRHPLWVSRPDGAWRAKIERLEINVPLEAALFAMPADVPREE